MKKGSSIKIVNLFDICNPKQWKTVSSKDLTEAGYPCYSANGKIGFYNTYNHEIPTLLIGCRGTCGSLHITEPFSYTSGNAMALDNLNQDQVDIKYLFYFLKQRGFKDVISGSSQPQITRQGLQKIKIPLPPIEDQKRIVKILDKADTLRQKRKQAIGLLDDYINSTFFDMFVDNSEEKNIPLVKLGELSLKITDGVHAKPRYTESGVPFISVKNITTTKLKFDSCKFISLKDHQDFTKRCKAELDDILYTKVGATYGRACIVDTEKEFSLYVSVALIKPKKDLVDPIFLKAVLNSSYIKRQADRSVKGAGVPDLHLIEIKKFKIPLPSMEEQKKFSKMVLGIETIKQKMFTQSDELETQFQALMQKAFKGE